MYQNDLDIDIQKNLEIQGDLPKQYDNNELYKEFLRTKEITRFISVKHFVTGNKFIVDIGTVNNQTNKLASSTVVYIDAFILLAYLKAVNSGQGAVIYPASEKANVDSDEGLTIFGGSSKGDAPIARVFKSHWWQNYNKQTNTKEYDSKSFMWKCAHFQAKQTSSGAFIPDFTKSISFDSIRMTRRNLAELELILTHALNKVK